MIPFGGVSVEEEKSDRYAKLHVQTWVYIHSALTMFVCMLGIASAVLLLVLPAWHEAFILYRQTLIYMRRHNPNVYWLLYRIVLACWIGMHFSHLATVLVTFFGAQLSKSHLIIPQIVALVIQLGVYILTAFSLVIISVTAAKVTWMSLLIILFFAFFASTNLVLLVAYYRILEEKNIALKALLATKSVHFKERRGGV